MSHYQRSEFKFPMTFKTLTACSDHDHNKRNNENHQNHDKGFRAFTTEHWAYRTKIVSGLVNRKRIFCLVT